MNWGQEGDRIQPINFFLPSELHFKSPYNVVLLGMDLALK